MDAKARRAITSIRRCIDDERYMLLSHVVQRMDERGLVWPDLLAIIDAPSLVQSDGEDDWARPRWLISGPCATSETVTLVCVIGVDARGEKVVFITMHWGLP
jgi:hypothetical protein